jgi:hypothetical protein
VRTLLNEHFRGQRDRAGAIWLLLVFELWHRNFLEGHRAEAPGPTPYVVRGEGNWPVANAL